MRLLRAIAPLRTLLAGEQGDVDVGQIMWCIAFLVMGSVIVYLGGSYISPEWRNFVGRPLP